MSKLKEVPMPPSRFTDDELAEFSKQNNPKPWRVARHKAKTQPARNVLVDAAGKIVKGRSALVRICRLVNTTEG